MNQWLLKITGLFFVGLAILGAVLPVLPTTPFLLVAAGCFAKSSPRLYQRLINNRTFGPLIVQWRENRTMPNRAKIIALSMIVLATIYSCIVLTAWWLKLLVVLLVIGPIIFISSIDTK